MNLDDPKLTAFALDELDEPEKSVIARAVAGSPEAQRFVDETRELAHSLKSEYANELEKETPATRAPVTLTNIHDDPWFWSIARPLAIAALLAICTVVAGVAVFRKGDLFVAGSKKAEPGSEAYVAGPPANQPSEVQGELEMPANVAPVLQPPPAPAPELAPTEAPMYSKDETKPGGYAGTSAAAIAKSAGRNATLFARKMASTAGSSFEFEEPIDRDRHYADVRAPSGPFNTATYDHIEENPFLDAATNPLSTFSIDVDTASYSNIRRFINDGSLPPKDAVRVEEMLNYFNYDYAPPTDGKPFAVHIDVAGCPWEASHRLVRIGLKGREIAANKRGPSNLVFLLDVSGSMTPPERLPLVKQAMRLLVEKLTENDRVAIVVYAGASGLALPSTTGDQKEKILSAIESLEPGGSTNGAEGIQLAYKIAADNFIKGGVNRVILATDGDFNVGLTDQGDLIRLIQEKAKSGVFLSVLGVGTDNLKDSTMQKLADKGNGNYAYLDSLDEARKVLVQQINGTLVTIAKDVKIQVEFNPARVASYRLIGYEKRMLRKEDFNNDKVDAGEIGAGHTVTALYEVVPAGAAVNPAASVPPVDPLKYQPAPGKAAGAAGPANQSQEMLTVKLRYKKPDGDKSELMEQALVDKGAQFAQAGPDLKFAAAVAEFGMILRDSNYKGNGTLGAVLEWAQEGKGADTNGYRAGFIGLVRKAQALRKG
jgi:Ca-activated chloride channel homolog